MSFWEKHKTAIIVTLITLFAIAVFLFFIYRKELTNYINTTMETIFPTKVAGHLNKLNPQYKRVFEEFVKGVIDLGYTPQINSSYRTFAEQQKQYDADHRNAKAGYSYHNYGLAIDMQVSKKVNGKTVTLGKSSSDAEWLASGIPQLAKSLGLTWGGDDKVFGTYQDAVHFDLRVRTTKDLLAMAFEQFGSDPNDIKGNEVLIA